jgi:hypothetical protein
VEEALNTAADICIYTNKNIIIEEIWILWETKKTKTIIMRLRV